MEGKTRYIFKDGSSHVIQMFYMERGHTASNLGLKFNLATIPYSELSKTDEHGNPISGSQFALYRANSKYEILDPKPVYLGTTDSDGKFQLLHPDEPATIWSGLPMSFADLPGEYFVLRETSVPAGYRSEGDMHLKKHTFGDGAVCLISDPDSITGSKWSTGSYASAKQLTSVNERNIWLRSDDPGVKGVQILENGQFKTVDASITETAKCLPWS